MTDLPNLEFLTSFPDRAETVRRQDRDYEQLESIGPMLFQDAVNVAARRMKDAIELMPSGPQADFLAGDFLYPEYMPMSLEPTNIDFERLVAKSKLDFSAYLVLRLAALMHVDDSDFPALRRAKKELALQIFPAPKRPPGRSPYANVRRDTLIVSEIKRRLTVGFTAARNRETEARNSACDVIVAALVANGYHTLTYEGVEKIWTGRANLKRPQLLLLALYQALEIEPG
jgi:hypothetical protein